MTPSKTNDKTFIGIDPGKSGAIAWLRGDEYGVEDMPLTTKGEVDVNALAHTICRVCKLRPDRALIVLEEQGSRPGQSCTATFSLGVTFGKLKAMLEMSVVPYMIVKPRVWKDAVLKGTSKDKEAALAYCKGRFPDVALAGPKGGVKDGRADALCMAVHAGMLSQYE